MPNTKDVVSKGYKQVSLPTSVFDEIADAAQAAGRSQAKHLEHCFRIALSIEQVLPSKAIEGLKAGVLPAPQLLMGLATILANPEQSAAFQRQLEANPHRINADPFDPSRATLTMPDGSKVQGTLDERGEFIPAVSPSAAQKGSHVPPAAKQRRKRSAEEEQHHAGKRSREAVAPA